MPIGNGKNKKKKTRAKKPKGMVSGTSRKGKKSIKKQKKEGLIRKY